MQTVFFTPGPSQIYPTVEKHIKQALKDNILSLSHRGREFKSIFSESTERLRLLLGIPQEYHIMFLSSATEAMERIIQGVVKRHSFHIATGAFACGTGCTYWQLLLDVLS